MKIFIPTKGRPNRQLTADQLSKAGIAHTLVLSYGESHPMWAQYIVNCGTNAGKKRDWEVSRAKSISAKRQDIITKFSGHGKIVMLDDDLVFYARAKDGSFHKSSPAELRRMFAWIEKVLDKYSHAGVVDKFMSNNTPRGAVESRRYNSVLAYNLDMWPSNPRPRFRVKVSEEHDVHLQLLMQGYPAIVSCEYSKNTSYYSEGGCADERSAISEYEGHRSFAEKWPGIVTVVQSKNSISGWAVKTRWAEAARLGRTVCDKA